MEPGRKDPSSERTVSAALEDEASSIYSREADGRDGETSLGVFSDARIFNCYAFGTGSRQTKTLF